jgi:hypothetical protein
MRSPRARSPRSGSRKRARSNVMVPDATNRTKRNSSKLFQLTGPESLGDAFSTCNPGNGDVRMRQDGDRFRSGGCASAPFDRRPGTSIATHHASSELLIGDALRPGWRVLSETARSRPGRLRGWQPTFDLAEQRRRMVVATAKLGEEASGSVAPVLLPIHFSPQSKQRVLSGSLPA